jgi:alkylation response protein AidB-like acyl-CoA dehydrogenase
VQFGRPIGSFQAIQHACADLLVAVETARAAVYWAGWVAGAEPDELPAAAALAHATAADAFFRAAAGSLQIHGGIGFTWEHDAHRYLKRARAARALLGGPQAARETIAQRIGL